MQLPPERLHRVLAGFEALYEPLCHSPEEADQLLTAAADFFTHGATPQSSYNDPRKRPFYSLLMDMMHRQMQRFEQASPGDSQRQEDLETLTAIWPMLFILQNEQSDSAMSSPSSLSKELDVSSDSESATPARCFRHQADLKHFSGSHTDYDSSGASTDAASSHRDALQDYSGPVTGAIPTAPPLTKTHFDSSNYNTECSMFSDSEVYQAPASASSTTSTSTNVCDKARGIRLISSQSRDPYRKFSGPAADARLVTPASKSETVLLVTIEGTDLAVTGDGMVKLSTVDGHRVNTVALFCNMFLTFDCVQYFNLNEPVPE